ncbi:MAG: hypothetical protein V1774_03510 [Candidatus Eisenbacteria bacterium]
MTAAAFDPPTLETLGIRIGVPERPAQAAGAGPGPWPAGAPLFLDAVALLPAADERAIPQWMRAIFLACISEANQARMVVRCFKDRVIAAGEIPMTKTDGAPALRASWRIHLQAEIGRELPAGRYYVQLSARQFLSNVVLIEVA